MSAVGREHLVLDLSCRRRDGAYYIVTDRWQKFTEVMLDERTLDGLSSYCDEFLVHAVDVEGKPGELRKNWPRNWAGGESPITYAGGVASFEDLVKLRELGQGHIDVTIGSALDLFGGNLPYKEVLKRCCSDRD